MVAADPFCSPETSPNNRLTSLTGILTLVSPRILMALNCPLSIIRRTLAVLIESLLANSWIVIACAACAICGALSFDFAAQETDFLFGC